MISTNQPSNGRVRRSCGLGSTFALSRYASVSLGLILVTLTTAAFAQQAADTDNKSTLTSSTELVLVPVQVKDSSGKPVRGLLQSDFVVRSDGKIQPVKIFEESDGTPQEAPAQQKSEMVDSGTEQEFSSVPTAGLPQQPLIIAIDRVNTPFADQARVRQELLKYFSQASSGQSFALVAITPDGLRQLQPFTTDQKALLNAVQQEQSKMGKAEDTHEALFVPQAPLCKLCGDEISVYKVGATERAAKATLLSFVQLEQAYADIPGRKSVIWLSSAIPDAEALATILNRGDIALYPVDLDLRGTGDDTDYLAEDQIDGSNTRSTGEQPVNDNTDMRVVATRTGGRYCPSMSALQPCIKQAVQDSTSYYMLGFYVSQQDRIVGWHKLEVKLTSGREKVHARSGYYLETKSTPTENDVRKGLLAAAQAQVGYTGVAFLVQRLAAPAAASPTTAGQSPTTAPPTTTPPSTTVAPSTPALSFRIRVPASSVMLNPGQQNLSYEIAMVPLSEKGEPASAVQTTRLELNAEQTQQALSKGWRYDETLAQTNAIVAVKFLVRDNGAGKIGSVTVPLSK